jgi:hypothetical protein
VDASSNRSIGVTRVAADHPGPVPGLDLFAADVFQLVS